MWQHQHPARGASSSGIPQVIQCPTVDERVSWQLLHPRCKSVPVMFIQLHSLERIRLTFVRPISKLRVTSFTKSIAHSAPKSATATATASTSCSHRQPRHSPQPHSYKHHQSRRAHHPRQNTFQKGAWSTKTLKFTCSCGVMCSSFVFWQIRVVFISSSLVYTVYAFEIGCLHELFQLHARLHST